MSESFWVKLTYKEYVGHYCEMTDAEIVADVRKSIGSFSNDRDDGNDFGAKMVRKANARMNGEAAGASRANGQKGGRPKKLTAAATTREGVDVSANGCQQFAGPSVNGRKAAVLGSGDRSPSPVCEKEGTFKSQEAYAESGKFRGSAKPKGESNTGITPPVVCPESGNHYDQEALDKPTISANSPAGAGVNLDSTQTIKRPDASSGNAEGVILTGSPIFLNCSGNGSRAACTSATSGQTIEALEKAGAAGDSPEFSSSPAALPVLAKTDPKPTKKAKAEVKPVEQKYPHGEFENIMLTTREYAQLCERLDNADSLIEEADGYFEAQPDKKRKYKSHYAMLLNWDRRRKEFEGVKPKKFKTAVDQDREEIKWLSDYYAKKERGENPPLPKIKMVGSA